MIPTIRLDNDTFQEIFEKARKRIPLLFPEWTNFNDNDSGIALLELFAWLKEAQDFHLDQIGLKNEAVYLKLLGLRRKEICPAKAVVSCYPVKEEITLEADTSFYAGDIPFLAKERADLYAGKLQKVVTGSKRSSDHFTERIWNEEDVSWRLPIFSERPEIENFIELDFAPGLMGGKLYGFYFKLFEDPNMKRNPVSSEFEPFVGIRAECLQEEINESAPAVWQDCEIERDDTYAFLYSGILRIRIPEALEGKRMQKLRFVFSEGEYDAAPILSQIYLNPVELLQKERITEQLLGEGTGFPGQSFSLDIKGVIPGEVEIEAEDPENPGSFEDWVRVEDFAASGPEDRHFTVEEQGNICFGDGFHGLAPEGWIKLKGLCRTEGIHGNVKKGRIHPENEDVFKAWNFEDVTGGADAESAQSCFARFGAELAQQYSAVTEKDYEKLVTQTPGLLIERAKIVKTDWERNRVVAAVKPWSKDKCPGLSRIYRNNILSFMEKRCLLGTEFKVVEPEYIKIRIYGDLELAAWYRDMEKYLKEKIQEYFKEFCSDFGSPILHSGLYGFIDGMQGVGRIRSLTIDAAGQGIRRNINGDVFLPPEGLAVLEQIQLSVSYVG